MVGVLGIETSQPNGDGFTDRPVSLTEYTPMLSQSSLDTIYVALLLSYTPITVRGGWNCTNVNGSQSILITAVCIWIVIWSGKRESNPHDYLGKVVFYH